jgi:superfamily II DNA or RNA helicase
MHNNASQTSTETYRTLPELELPPVIDTARHDLRTEFYEPCLRTAVSYDRGVGFFSTRWFSQAARGVAALVHNGGAARWLVSPKLSEADAEALLDGYDARALGPGALMELLDPQLEELQTGLAVETRNTLGWLIAEDYVDIKVAMPTGTDGGLFHDKFGVIEDVSGNRLSFHGSKNDSERAFHGYEAYTLDGDWRDENEAATVADHAERCEWLWEGRVDGVATYPLPEAAEAGLLDLRSTDAPPYRSPSSDGGVPAGRDGPPEDGPPDEAPLRDTVTLRPYQAAALDEWVANGHHGIYEMATGLGKTITAMASIDKYADTLETGLLVVIAVPENYLGRQWASELTEWGFDEPLMAYSSANHTWAADLAELVTDTELGITSPGIAITTHDTFHKERFREHLSRAHVPRMLVVDEVHGVGTECRISGLDDGYAARLGLSATPERYMDEDGTDALTDYFGGTVFEYGLAEGIPEYLAEYEYHPRVVELSELEAEEYIAESKRLAATISSDETTGEDIERVAQQRADIGKTAAGKVRALRQVLDELPSQEGLLLFSHHEQLETVTDELHAHDIKYHQYTQEEGPEQRERLLESFSRADGGLDALVGIHCLDEGVDVSSAQTAILLSSTGNPRQFIQRRGRVLRQHEDKDRARIYDFIVVPPREHFDDLLDAEKTLIRTQLDRHEEFARTAVNADEARATVQELRDALDDEQ